MAKENFVNEIWDDLVDSFSNIRTQTSMPRYLLPNMPCLFGKNLQVCYSCCVKLTLFKRKLMCCKCQKVFCGRCVGVESDKHTLVCRICAILLMKPPDKKLLLSLRVKDLQCFLISHHVSTHGCVEKEDLVNLLLVYTNEKPSYGSSSSSTVERDDLNIPDEVEVGVEIGTNGIVNLDDSTNFGASTSTNYSSPTTDTATRQLGVAVSHTSEEDLKISGAGALQSPDPGPSSSSDFVEPSTSTTNDLPSDEHRPSAPPTETAPTEAAPTEAAPTAQALQTPETDSATGSPVFVRPTMSTIGSRGDMEQMSVKQLKCLLASHRVDYHGCCEKAELVERATRLWMDYRAARADLESLDLESLCKVCMDAPVECVMLECGHMATCTDCGRQLSECPICRQYVVRIVRTFRA